MCSKEFTLEEGINVLDRKGVSKYYEGSSYRALQDLTDAGVIDSTD